MGLSWSQETNWASEVLERTVSVMGGDQAQVTTTTGIPHELGNHHFGVEKITSTRLWPTREKAGRFFCSVLRPRIICLSFCCCFCCLFQGSIELWTSKLLAADLLSAQFFPKSQLDGQEAQLDYVLVTGAEAVLLPYMGWGLRRQGERDWFQGVATAGEKLWPTYWAGHWVAELSATLASVTIRTHDPLDPKKKTNRLFL